LERSFSVYTQYACLSPIQLTRVNCHLSQRSSLNPNLSKKARGIKPRAKMGSKKDSHQSAAFLGEGIFTMGYSKKYIMYWGVLQVL